jgi:NAD(P)-dependent dehydrogenase (short-subunit alcohol dehydrogenase family)
MACEPSSPGAITASAALSPFAREGADVLIAYLNEHDDAKEVAELIQKEGRKAVLVHGDLRSADHCRKVIERALDELGGVDILVNNAAHQATFAEPRTSATRNGGLRSM